MKMYALYIAALAAGSSLIIQFLQLFPFPQNNINWPISIGWAAMLIPPLYLSIKKQDSLKIKAMVCCSIAWVLGYFMTMDVARHGFDHLSAVFLYASLSGMCFYFKQRKMGIIGACMVIFGVIMLVFTGRYVTTEAHFWWRFTWNVFYGLLLVPPVVELLDSHDGSQAEVQSNNQQELREVQKAA